MNKIWIRAIFAALMLAVLGGCAGMGGGSSGGSAQQSPYPKYN